MNVPPVTTAASTVTVIKWLEGLRGGFKVQGEKWEHGE